MPIISNIMYKWALLIVTVMSVNTDRVTALSPAPSPEADCTTLVYNMSDCLTYVEKGSNVSKPDKACCPELGEMLDTKPVCLCQLLGKSKDFPVELDVNRALDLPHVCGFSTPSASLCSGIAIGGPAAEPTSSQEPSSSSSSSTGSSLTMTP
ncbi:hypothetical protein RND81_04G155700 [Saponaria officinalis]|uniref:Bifunctional inhibitor/plant lipid transfer protein/seed storage helical domain-containing protein n=1 Tax=Saponaria officinalis TaxID=3572 RepID=A0AAW1LHZ0_SAPOF